MTEYLEKQGQKSENQEGEMSGINYSLYIVSAKDSNSQRVLMILDSFLERYLYGWRNLNREPSMKGGG